MEAVINVVILNEADLSAMTDTVAKISSEDQCVKFGKMLKLRGKEAEMERFTYSRNVEPSRQ